MPETIKAAMKQKALLQFRQRLSTQPNFLDAYQRSILLIPKGMQNDQLYAGSDMIFYCKHCGWPSDIKQEEHFLIHVRTTCGECEGLEREGWIQEALASKS